MHCFMEKLENVLLTPETYNLEHFYLGEVEIRIISVLPFFFFTESFENSSCLGNFTIYLSSYLDLIYRNYSIPSPDV